MRSQLFLLCGCLMVLTSCQTQQKAPQQMRAHTHSPQDYREEFDDRYVVEKQLSGPNMSVSGGMDQVRVKKSFPFPIDNGS